MITVGLDIGRKWRQTLSQGNHVEDVHSNSKNTSKHQIGKEIVQSMSSPVEATQTAA